MRWSLKMLLQKIVGSSFLNLFIIFPTKRRGVKRNFVIQQIVVFIVALLV
jgi:hypothetical protein